MLLTVPDLKRRHPQAVAGVVELGKGLRMESVMAKKPSFKPADLQPAVLRQKLEAIIAQPRGAVRDDAIADLFEQLHRQCDILTTLANGYPYNGGISAVVWTDGGVLACLADDFTEFLVEHGDLTQAIHAGRLAVSLACQVMSHYPEQIFPRVLRTARIYAQHGDHDNACVGYAAIMDDFLSQDWDDVLSDSEPLDDTSRFICGVTLEAATQYTAQRPGGDYEALRQRLDERLQQP